MQKAFKAEVNELLNLVIGSLYSNRDIFLRELISNASDALDKRRFLALSDKALEFETGQGAITLHADENTKTIVLSDNGIGMSSAEMEENIGTIANSGTKNFMRALKEDKSSSVPQLIGQFGVGFYSAFMIADSIEVVSRKAGSAEATRWVSSGKGGYELSEASRAEAGTTITMHVKEDAAEYLQEWKLRKLVKTYSDFIAYPITMKVKEFKEPEEGAPEDAQGEEIVKDEVVNSQKAIWTRPKSEISATEYNEFFKHVAHDFMDPAEVIHYRGEGSTEFDALLFVPGRPPMDLFMPNEHRGVHLYVRRVFIMDDCKELMPDYLRFIRGVVDSADLPLNVSREMLQEDKLLRTIQKNLVKKVLDTFKSMKEKDFDKYAKFWKDFGKVLKEGLHSDHANKERLQELLAFESSSTEAGKLTTLKDYVGRMAPEQKDIYFITGHNRSSLEHSPHLEGFRKKGYEVIFLTDPIDEWVVQAVTDYEGKAVRSVAKGELADDATREELKKASEAAKSPLEAIRQAIGEDVKEIRFSSRLTDSACCLVADEHAMGLHMERLYRSMNHELPPVKRILELNKDHQLIQDLLAIAEKDPQSAQVSDYAHLLLDQALLMEGSPVKDAGAFARRLTSLMGDKIKG